MNLLLGRQDSAKCNTPVFKKSLVNAGGKLNCLPLIWPVQMVREALTKSKQPRLQRQQYNTQASHLFPSVISNTFLHSLWLLRSLLSAPECLSWSNAAETHWLALCTVCVGQVSTGKVWMRKCLPTAPIKSGAQMDFRCCCIAVTFRRQSQNLYAPEEFAKQWVLTDRSEDGVKIMVTFFFFFKSWKALANSLFFISVIVLFSSRTSSWWLS